MQTAQKEKRTSEAQLRANKKYSNSKWRPNVYLNMEDRELKVIRVLMNMLLRWWMQI